MTSRLSVHSRLVSVLGLVIGLALVSASACQRPRSEPVRARGATVVLEASLDPPRGRVGTNRLWLSLMDRDGAPLESADLRVRVYMVEMGAMPAMGGWAQVAALGGGAYRADFELEMGSTWQVEVRAAAAGARAERFEGSLTVGSAGVELRSARAPEAPTAAGEEQRHGDEHPGEFWFDPARVQRIGVRTGPVERRALSATVRSVGRIAYDESRLEDVAARVAGFVETLRADAVGVRVERGEVLLTLYSPDLFAAQRELLQAAASSEARGGASGGLARAARRRLRLWGISARDIEQVIAQGRAQEALPLRAPASGYVIAKDVVAGAAVESGQRLLRIAPLDRVWVEVELYEQELARVRPGQPARIRPSHVPGREYDASVAYVYPYLEGPTRTARARIELANPDLELRPDMFADVEIETERRESLTVPADALLHAGERSFVFVVVEPGRFRPRAVETGLRDGESVEIRAGLRGDETIVHSGTFLIASESRLRSALEQW